MTQEEVKKKASRRVMDIEDVVRWAYRDELPKLAVDNGEFSFLFSIAELGIVVDESRDPGFPAAMGECHPDALKVQSAVEALKRFADAPIEADLELGRDFAATMEEERVAMRRAFGQIDLLIASMARMPQSKSRPTWRERPIMAAVTGARGKPLVLKWDAVRTPKFGGGESCAVMLVPAPSEGQSYYPLGAHCPLRYEEEPQDILNERADYLAWWAGLNALADELFAELETIAPLPPSAPQKPWLGETELGKPPRIFEDLTARIYQKESREQAAAHRALGLRRASSARGGQAAPIARRSQRFSDSWLSSHTKPRQATA